MALVETAPKSKDCENNLRMACADELAAQTLYRDLKEQVKNSSLPFEAKEEIVARLAEIIKDEEEHLGSLLYCLNLLNPETMGNVNAGSKGA